MSERKAWDEIFTQRGKVFNEPHEDLNSVIESLEQMDAKQVLDLGCGTGRHTIALARKGFSVFGIDNAPSGLKMTKDGLDKESLHATLVKHEMTEPFPWPDGSFDAVVSVQVIHHADVGSIKKIISEIKRILKTGGMIFITVPKLKNQGENFQEIEPNTFIPLDGQEKGLPHHYFTPEELRDFFSDFHIQDIHIDAGNHYCLTGFKK